MYRLRVVTGRILMAEQSQTLSLNSSVLKGFQLQKAGTFACRVISGLLYLVYMLKITILFPLLNLFLL